MLVKWLFAKKIQRPKDQHILQAKRRQGDWNNYRGISLLRYTFLWTCNPVSRSITWSLFTLKASTLVKWQLSTWSLWLCQIIDWFNFETRPNSPRKFQNGLLKTEPFLIEYFLTYFYIKAFDSVDHWNLIEKFEH